MSVIKTAAFSFRDFLESILPTFIAILLFIPCYFPDTSIDMTFIAVVAILFGYVVSIPAIEISEWIHKRLPYFGKKIEIMENKKKEWLKRWDAPKFFYNLKSDEREYQYLTASYARSFRVMSFYFLLFGVEQLRRFSFEAWNETSLVEVQNWVSLIKETKTPMFWDGDLPTALSFILSLLFAYYLFKSYLSEYEDLFGEEGQYVTLSKKYQREMGGIAKSIWGKITYQDEDFDDAEVILVELPGSEEIEATATNTEGEFEFANRFEELENKKAMLKIRKGQIEHDFEIEISSKLIPEFTIKLL